MKLVEKLRLITQTNVVKAMVEGIIAQLESSARVAADGGLTGEVLDHVSVHRFGSDLDEDSWVAVARALDEWSATTGLKYEMEFAPQDVVVISAKGWLTPAAAPTVQAAKHRSGPTTSPTANAFISRADVAESLAKVHKIETVVAPTSHTSWKHDLFDLARKVSITMFEAVESYHHAHYGASLAYLLNAILHADDANQRLQINLGQPVTDDQMPAYYETYFVSVLKREFPLGHVVWQYVDIDQSLLVSIPAAES